MGKVRSFYLGDQVIGVLDKWPRNQRSRIVNWILATYLEPPGKGLLPAADEERIRELIQQVLENKGGKS